MAMPMLSTYAATKDRMLHWSRCLAAELRPMGINVLCVARIDGTGDPHGHGAGQVPPHPLSAMRMHGFICSVRPSTDKIIRIIRLSTAIPALSRQKHHFSSHFSLLRCHYVDVS
jgi:short-subunit dehydrogenase